MDCCDNSDGFKLLCRLNCLQVAKTVLFAQQLTVFICAGEMRWKKNAKYFFYSVATVLNMVTARASRCNFSSTLFIALKGYIHLKFTQEVSRMRGNVKFLWKHDNAFFLRYQQVLEIFHAGLGEGVEVLDCIFKLHITSNMVLLTSLSDTISPFSLPCKEIKQRLRLFVLSSPVLSFYFYQ